MNCGPSIYFSKNVIAFTSLPNPAAHSVLPGDLLQLPLSSEVLVCTAQEDFILIYLDEGFLIWISGKFMNI